MSTHRARGGRLNALSDLEDGVVEDSLDGAEQTPDGSARFLALVEEYLGVTKKAWELASCRDYDGVGSCIEERNRIIAAFTSGDWVLPLAEGFSQKAVSMFEETAKLDKEIRTTLRAKMDEDAIAIKDTMEKSRILRAYDRNLLGKTSPRAFDNRR